MNSSRWLVPSAAANRRSSLRRRVRRAARHARGGGRRGDGAAGRFSSPGPSPTMSSAALLCAQLDAAIGMCAASGHRRSAARAGHRGGRARRHALRRAAAAACSTRSVRSAGAAPARRSLSAVDARTGAHILKSLRAFVSGGGGWCALVSVTQPTTCRPSTASSPRRWGVDWKTAPAAAAAVAAATAPASAAVRARRRCRCRRPSERGSERRRKERRRRWRLQGRPLPRRRGLRRRRPRRRSCPLRGSATAASPRQCTGSTCRRWASGLSRCTSSLLIVTYATYLFGDVWLSMWIAAADADADADGGADSPVGHHHDGDGGAEATRTARVGGAALLAAPKGIDGGDGRRVPRGGGGAPDVSTRHCGLLHPDGRACVALAPPHHHPPRPLRPAVVVRRHPVGADPLALHVRQRDDRHPTQPTARRIRPDGDDGSGLVCTIVAAAACSRSSPRSRSSSSPSSPSPPTARAAR